MFTMTFATSQGNSQIKIVLDYRRQIVYYQNRALNYYADIYHANYNGTNATRLAYLPQNSFIRVSDLYYCDAARSVYFTDEFSVYKAGDATNTSQQMAYVNQSI